MLKLKNKKKSTGKVVPFRDDDDDDEIIIRGGSSRTREDPKDTKKKPKHPPRDLGEEVIVFDKKLKQIKKAIKNGKKGEALDIQILHGMRDAILDLLPVAEESYRKYPYHTNASALNTFVNQEREILNDIRSLEDFAQRAEQIVEIVREQYRLIAQNLMDEVFRLKTEIKGRSDKKGIDEAFRVFLQSQGKFLEESRKASGDKVLKFMVKEDKK